MRLRVGDSGNMRFFPVTAGVAVLDAAKWYSDLRFMTHTPYH